MNPIKQKTVKLREAPVITIHLHAPDKEALKQIAESKGLQLIPFCRMILLKEIKNSANE